MFARYVRLNTSSSPDIPVRQLDSAALTRHSVTNCFHVSGLGGRRAHIICVLIVKYFLHKASNVPKAYPLKQSLQSTFPSFYVSFLAASLMSLPILGFSPLWLGYDMLTIWSSIPGGWSRSRLAAITDRLTTSTHRSWTSFLSFGSVNFLCIVWDRVVDQNLGEHGSRGSVWVCLCSHCGGLKNRFSGDGTSGVC